MDWRVQKRTLRGVRRSAECEITATPCCGTDIGPTTPGTIQTRRKILLPPGSYVGASSCVDVPDGDCCGTPSASGASGVRLTKRTIGVPLWAVGSPTCEVISDCDLCPVPVTCSPGTTIDYPRWITVTSFYWDDALRSTTLCHQATVKYQDQFPPYIWSETATNSFLLTCPDTGRGPRINFPIRAAANPFSEPYGQIAQNLLGSRYVITLVEPTPFSQYDPDYFNSMDEISGDTEAWSYTHSIFGSMTFVKSNNRFWYTPTSPKLAIYRYGADYLLLWGLDSSIAVGTAINAEAVSGSLSWGRKIGGNLVFSVTGSLLNQLPAGVNTVTMTPTTGTPVSDVIGIGDKFIKVEFDPPYFSPLLFDFPELRVINHYAMSGLPATVQIASDDNSAFRRTLQMGHEFPGFGSGSTLQLRVNVGTGILSIDPDSYSVGDNHVWTYSLSLDGITAAIEVRT